MIFNDLGQLVKPPHYDTGGGLCMHCNRPSFINGLKAVPDVSVFIYVEIGVYDGGTMRWAIDYMKSERKEWIAIGIEILDWIPHAPFAKNTLCDFWNGELLTSNDVDSNIHPHNKSVSIFVCGSHCFLEHTKITPSFIFIDGCHSTKCCMLDFELSEKISIPGTVIAIHDIDPGYQGLDPGLHCNEGIGVLQAIKNLGLYDRIRPGWKEIGRSLEDYENHGCLFVQKL